ncbi:radical SAM family heme chaperone HemW [Chengkuizengella sediminis]|uniref:radical SAM family heme chaperone HemW n=1 Tax=Chengkuizengella sediminis TaxID=1885917 RepID=UPI0013894370|nr:radical SAM family heme chaperone HemW [Chengkuizengella sediminis]NDI33755.1 oxygen-independent coproporphyrinogen III oxidase [Chengkuizengella sediminis]
MTTFNSSAAKAVYIHIPFCKHKCYYCDFNTYALPVPPIDEYLVALEKELKATVEKFPPGQIETIFVGGGTPTILDPQQMKSFLQLVNHYFPNQHEQLEFTMEANPGTTDVEKLKVMKSGGVNRISFGVQSFQNDILKDIGRIHDTFEVYESIKNAKEIGFDNLSIDLMFGLPNQTLKNMEESLNQALSLDLQHYSIYSLKVEENTVFHSLYQKDKLPLPAEEEELNMFLLIMNRLNEAGYQQYEISNFAKPGFESNHNKMYWNNQSYYGIGAGAHSYMQGTRYMNVRGVQDYLDAVNQGLPVIEEHQVSPNEAMEDFMMVGLRLMEGVNKEDFIQQFSHSMDQVFKKQLNKLINHQLLESTENGFRLTKRGILLGNEVFAEFISSL